MRVEKSPEPDPKKKLVVLVMGRKRRTNWDDVIEEECPFEFDATAGMRVLLVCWVRWTG